ncbi:MAG: hypothetical protein KGL23_08075 [Acidobacteriota bacterium]|nr:hypothetical protein [Acidobacteriota bacterium]MDE3030969.1 hypothetical protein [Acidobacteriota bacterium]MDE3093291.1 hypothetical protein [Acidobacteriota bacterium]MDE3139980.1 hypothetical protein [Acidobacteriota bacterium]MDE3147374.1 hypothetical protein [Acidobacteriota bacterium]
MYRPKKKKFVRGVSAASVVAVGAAVGLGVMVLHQGATNPVLSPSGSVSASATGAPATTPTSTSATSTSATATPAFHIVGLARRHDDSSSGTESGSYGDN